MKLTGRRTSSNLDDRRSHSGGRSGKATGLGLGGLIVVGLIMWLMGGNPLDLLTSDGASSLTGQSTQEYVATAEDEELVTFSSQILAGTEDVWTALFQEMGRTYQPPKLVVYNGTTRSGCGSASSSTGPFYCSADQAVYIDVSFFKEMKSTLGADGDFAYAYVIAHEVGHHVQYLLGTLAEVDRAKEDANEKEANQLSVRLELQADFYAGIWAHYDNQMFGSLEPGDIQEGLDAATAIGDDRLQKQGRGYTVPDSFTHGTSAQRSKWLNKGLQTGDLSAGDTFSISYNRL